MELIANKVYKDPQTQDQYILLEINNKESNTRLIRFHEYKDGVVGDGVIFSGENNIQDRLVMCE